MKKNSFLNRLPLYLVIFTDYFGWGVVLTVFVPLILGTSFIKTPGQELHAFLYGLILAVYSLGQIFGAPLLGELSDHFGRKKILLLSLFGSFLTFIFSGVSIYFKSFTLLALSRALAGLFAGNTSLAQSGISDLSHNNEKAKAMTYVTLFMGLGFFTGPLFGGLLSDKHLVSWFNFRIPFYFNGLLFLATLFMILWIFKESFKPRETKFDPFKMITNLRDVFKMKHFRILSLAFYLFLMGHFFYGLFITAYTFKVYGYTPFQLGLITGWSAISFISGALVLRFFLKFMKIEKLIVWPSIAYAAFVVLMILFKIQILTIILMFIVGALSAMPRAAYFTIAANTTSTNIQGKVFGSFTSLFSFAVLFTPLLSGFLLGIDLNLPFVFNVIFLILSVLVYLWFKKEMCKNPPQTSQK